MLKQTKQCKQNLYQKKFRPLCCSVSNRHRHVMKKRGRDVTQCRRCDDVGSHLAHTLKNKKKKLIPKLFLKHYLVVCPIQTGVHEQRRSCRRAAERSWKEQKNTKTPVQRIYLQARIHWAVEGPSGPPVLRGVGALAPCVPGWGRMVHWPTGPASLCRRLGVSPLFFLLMY